MQLTFGYVASGNSRLHQASGWSRDKRRGRRLIASSHACDSWKRSPPFLFRAGCSTRSQMAAVYNHCKSSNHSFKPEEVVILDKEDRWFERGVREAIWERVEQPALNKKGGLRFQLSHAWDEAIRRLPRRLSRDQSEA